MTGISEKVALITGASSGIGEASVRELAAAGASLFIGARRGDQLKALADELGDAVAWRELDVTDGQDFDAFADAAEARFGRIDVLVNNAGVMPLSPLAALKRDEWKRMIDVNIHGVLNGIAAVLPRFVGQKNGHIVNVASVGAHFVVPTGAVYCGTKYAVWAITEGLRQEHDNIRATIISPGVTKTELGDDISDPAIAAALKGWRQNSLTPGVTGTQYRIAEPKRSSRLNCSKLVSRGCPEAVAIGRHQHARAVARQRQSREDNGVHVIDLRCYRGQN